MTDVKHLDNHFDLYQNEEKAGLLNYRLKDDNVMEIMHTEVNEQYSGHGLGKKLVQAAVEYALEKGYTILPSCSYANAVIRKTPEFQKALN